MCARVPRGRMAMDPRAKAPGAGERAMQLTLGDAELDLLRDILARTMGDLRMEIRDTETAAYKERLKRDEHLLAALLTRLGGSR